LTFVSTGVLISLMFGVSYKLRYLTGTKKKRGREDGTYNISEIMSKEVGHNCR